MIAKFQIILEGVTPLKIQMFKKRFQMKSWKQKENTTLLKGYSEYSENLFESKNKKELNNI